MGQAIVVVDAFTARPFGGNPAAVCVSEGPRDERWMKLVAREMNLSETAFLHPEGDPGTFRLRWLTPTIEVDLCGHATLASAHVLWSEGHLPSDQPARFLTRSGPLSAERRDSWIELDFPATPPRPAEPGLDPGALAALLGVPVRGVFRSPFDLLVEVESEEAVRGLRPDVRGLAAIDARGLIVTARASSPGFDFVSRFFAPRAGIDEDPVTGSSHSALGPFWGERLGKTELSAAQVSARGGVLRVGLRDDRVRLAGQAVTVLRGQLLPEDP